MESNMSTPRHGAGRSRRRIGAWLPLLLLLTFCQQALALTGQAVEDRPPFLPGERLTYALRWGSVPAGTVVLEVLPAETICGVKAHHFAMTANSNSFVDAFYPVRNRFDGYADLDMKRSLLYRAHQREGRHRREECVVFDWSVSMVQYENFGKKRKPLSIQPETFDPLSVFYAFRRQPLQRGLSLHAGVTDGKKWVLGTALVLDRQRVRVPCGEFDAFVVEPDLRDVGGVFKKSDDVSMKIWVTADEYRIPVRVVSRIVLGEFVAEVISIERGRPDPLSPF